MPDNLIKSILGSVLSKTLLNGTSKDLGKGWLTKDLDPHKYGCIMAVLPDSLRKEITDWAIENVLECHLAPEGIELGPHCTIKYGLVDSSEETLSKIKELLSHQLPFPITLAGLSLFKGGVDGDVLKVDVDSTELHKLNKLISETFPCEDKYPEYKPHVTIAYLDPKVSKYYEKLSVPFVNTYVLIDSVEWSGTNGERKIIPLGRSASDFFGRVRTKSTDAELVKEEGFQSKKPFVRDEAVLGAELANSEVQRPNYPKIPPKPIPTAQLLRGLDSVYPTPDKTHYDSTQKAIDALRTAGTDLVKNLQYIGEYEWADKVSSVLYRLSRCVRTSNINEAISIGEQVVKIRPSATEFEHVLKALKELKAFMNGHV